MSRAISLYMDRVTLSLDELQELEKDAEALAKRTRARSPSAPRDEGTDDSPRVDPRSERSVSSFMCCLSYLPRLVSVLPRRYTHRDQCRCCFSAYHDPYLLTLCDSLFAPSGSSSVHSCVLRCHDLKRSYVHHSFPAHLPCHHLR